MVGVLWLTAVLLVGFGVTWAWMVLHHEAILKEIAKGKGNDTISETQEKVD